MRIVVTGGAGFIGSHLCEALLEQGHYVISLDNFFTGTTRLSHENAEVVRHDVCDPWHIECDQIYHLACPASPVHYQRNPVRTIKTAVIGTLNALECARDVGARLLITSTSEVYGDPTEHPQTEAYWGNVNPIGPRACYDEGKRCGEALAASWVQQYSTDVRIARLFNVYGPRMSMNDGRLIPTFVRQALAGEPLTVYGDGSQTRSFCYVTDMVDALMRLMNWPGLVKAPVFNLGNPDERTILSVAQKVNRHFNRPENAIDFRRLPQDDPKQRLPDIARAKGCLEWEPKTFFGQGIDAMVEEMRGRLK
jgi:UDP-glucuronate decarboxylase